MRKVLLIAALAATLTGCVTPTAYAPASARGGVGYSESRIESDRWRISFTGGGGAPPAQVEDYALLRAADLALTDGFDWFVVDDRTIGQSGYQGATLGVGIGGASFGRHSAVGVSGGGGIPLGGGPQFTAQLEVRMGKGPRPTVPGAYDAHDVQRTLGARVAH